MHVVHRIHRSRQWNNTDGISKHRLSPYNAHLNYNFLHCKLQCDCCCVFSCDGPGSQCVTQRYRLDWSTYLVTSLGVIYVSVDSRGSAGRGARFLHAVHRRFGSMEVSDQLAVARSAAVSPRWPINKPKAIPRNLCRAGVFLRCLLSFSFLSSLPYFPFLFSFLRREVAPQIKLRN